MEELSTSDIKDKLSEFPEADLWGKLGEYWDKKDIINELLQATNESDLIKFVTQ